MWQVLRMVCWMQLTPVWMCLTVLAWHFQFLTNCFCCYNQNCYTLLLEDHTSGLHCIGLLHRLSHIPAVYGLFKPSPLAKIYADEIEWALETLAGNIRGKVTADWKIVTKWRRFAYVHHPACFIVNCFSVYFGRQLCVNSWRDMVATFNICNIAKVLQTLNSNRV